MADRGLRERIDYLINVGWKHLRESGQDDVREAGFAGWLAAVRDVTAECHGQGSAVLEEIENLRQSADDRSQYQHVLESAMASLDYTREVWEASAQADADRATKSATAVDYDGFRRHLDSYLADEYFKKWPFRVPVAILFAAVVFAVLGIIQVRSYMVNLNELFDGAVARVRQDLSVRATEIGTELDRQVEVEKDNIEIAAMRRVATVEAAVVPPVKGRIDDLQATVVALEPEVSWVSSSVADMNAQVAPLATAVTAIETNANRNIVEDASLVLFRSTWIPWFVLGAAVLFVLWRFGKLVGAVLDRFGGGGKQ